jgi:predicted permease
LIELIHIFSANILPIFLIGGIGFLLQKYSQVDVRTLSKIIFYIFTPTLVFTSLTESPLQQSEILLMVAYTVAVSLTIGLIALLACLILKLDRQLTSAVMITVMFTNAGNYGISLNLFAFGEEAMTYAALYFSINAVLLYTIGILIASLGRATFREAILRLFKIPMLYALVLAIIYNTTSVSLPIYLDRAINLLSQAAIPSMIVLLGMQLQRVRWRENAGALTAANLLRLIASPFIAIIFSLIFGLKGAARQAGIVEPSMPSAVTNAVIATEFDVMPSFVTTIVTTTTLLSPLTLTPLLWYLGK